MPSAVLFNKPYGVVCQFSPQAGRETLADYLRQPGIYPAGRLDADSEGLVVLTADGALQHAIADPRHKLVKTYCVQVEGTVTETALRTLRRGVALSDYTTRPAEAREISEPPWLWPRTPPIRFRREIPTGWLEVRLTEGKNRQVRRMTAAVGLPTLRLIRYAVGIWTLENLPPGNWREVEVEPVTTGAASPHGAPRRRVNRPRAASVTRRATQTRTKPHRGDT